jgi:hypothetical protein
VKVELQDANLSIISLLCDGDGSAHVSMNIKRRDVEAMVITLRSIADTLEIDPMEIN